MSYWSHTGSGAAGHTRSSYGPPPLPPRNDGRHPIGASGVVPPPIPPRPAGFGYQPVRDPGLLETLSQPTSTPARIQKQPIANDTRTGVHYSDISQFFPDGKIPPPPPRPGVSPSPQPPLNAGKPDTGVSPTVFHARFPPMTSFQERPPKQTNYKIRADCHFRHTLRLRL